MWSTGVGAKEMEGTKERCVDLVKFEVTKLTPSSMSLQRLP
jgi:hypothetical protein